jgi:outer membrane protein assembly factor BamC
MRKTLIILTLFCLGGCSSVGLEEPEIIDKITQPDYASSSKSKKLEIPPDLSEIAESDNYSTPGDASSYKDFKEKQNVKTLPTKMLVNSEGMKIIKSGALRWLEVEKDADLIWPYIQEFWEEMGFSIKIANKKTGIIETEWLDTSKIKINSNSGSLSRLDIWLDSISGIADRRKFRTRVEPGRKPGLTEIYLTQRSASSGNAEHQRVMDAAKESGTFGNYLYELPEYKTDSDDKTTEKTKMTVKRDLDTIEIDAELLTRLMVKLGATDLDAKQKIDNPISQIRAELITQDNETYIRLNDPFDRSWRRLSLALDLIGFITQDKNRSEGIYYVTYKNQELPLALEEKDKGILDTLAFWRDDELKEDQSKSEDIEKSEDIKKEAEGESETDNSAVKNEPSNEPGWTNLLNWGAPNEKGPNEDAIQRQYRIKLLPLQEGAKVYLELPDGSTNTTKVAQEMLKILYEHLK